MFTNLIRNIKHEELKQPHKFMQKPSDVHAKKKASLII
jgi:hypothetical protein